jgi:hypothetical protein
VRCAHGFKETRYESSDALNDTLQSWEHAEYAAIICVIIGVIGEFISEFTKWGTKTTERKDRIGKYSTLFLIVALAAEFICLIRANTLSDRIVAQANRDAANAIVTAEAERFERIKLEARVAPRTLTLDQQKLIKAALSRFAGQTVTVSSYSLDGEGAGIADQIRSVLTSAGLTLEPGSMDLPAGAFYRAIQIRGPQNDLLVSLSDALSSIGKLKVYVNGPVPRTGATLSGNAIMSGSALLGGGGGVVNIPVPTSGPVTIMVGIKPSPTVQ